MRWTLLILATLLALPVQADPPAGKQADKERRERQREADKAQREYARDVAKLQRDWRKEDRRAWRERQRALREARRAALGEGWFNGNRWQPYASVVVYRDALGTALHRHAPPLVWEPPTTHEVLVYQPGMRLPAPWYADRYALAPLPYGLPPPPAHHRWVIVDDDAVLVAIATGLVADFVYDLFE